MNTEHLVHMANQIGAFFESFPDRQEAKKGIADHIHKFWEPRMRLGLLNMLNKPDTHNLAELVREALLEHQTSLQAIRH
ncbi:formate dehydrogenase subunit delta [Undibacterium oligocarboniphilum]|uniref:Formate dehydrogenase subunit delta n=1 Tax=Undibacterium oligocarboniphilum TaxID=666702 RepID=A0A850QFZ2_9BURK|nr:formate dehydrogenase subunit delta [Undibacterium oligocarboniphilum]MBC3871062.1 formate dehydrogenase subunit delta [Undibacterium oligocarboniphilum]NVO76315.1 formate dehydrogenase subunit delta [Undibacterium oligocarboniphilum]